MVIMIVDCYIYTVNKKCMHTLMGKCCEKCLLEWMQIGVMFS